MDKQYSRAENHLHDVSLEKFLFAFVFSSTIVLSFLLNEKGRASKHTHTCTIHNKLLYYKMENTTSCLLYLPFVICLSRFLKQTTHIFSRCCRCFVRHCDALAVHVLASSVIVVSLNA